jgi:hypothetical protein
VPGKSAIFDAGAALVCELGGGERILSPTGTFELLRGGAAISPLLIPEWRVLMSSFIWMSSGDHLTESKFGELIALKKFGTVVVPRLWGWRETAPAYIPAKRSPTRVGESGSS